MTFRVFINYRREDASGHAGRLYESLLSRFSSDQVFMDIDAIEPGIDFVDALDDAMKSCDAVIALIGKHWLTATDAGGRRRLDNADDYVRLEIEGALQRNVRVVPVLVAGASMPGPNDLPASLRPLTRRNALEITDTRWHFDLGRLVSFLERLEQQAQAGQDVVDSSRLPPAAPEPAATREGSGIERAEMLPLPAVPPGEDVRVPAPSPPPSRELPKRTRALVLAGAALAAVVAGTIVVLTRSDDPASSPRAGQEGPVSPAEEPQASGPAPPATPDPAPDSPAGLVSRWTRDRVSASVFGGPGDQVVNRAVVFGSGLVAVGYDARSGAWDAAVWTSADGSTWQRRSHPSFGGSGDQSIAGVTSDGATLVAAGADDSGGDEDPAVWTSSDAIEWTREAPANAVFDRSGDQAIRRVAAAGPGFVAVGYDRSSGDLDAAVWTFDGTVWSGTGSESFGGPGDQEMRGVAAFGSGAVAVGLDIRPGADQDAAVWLFDGSGWRRISSGALGGPGDQQMTLVVGYESGLVAVGYDTSGGDEDAAIWTSPDGIDWQRIPHDERLFGGPGDQEIVGASVVGSGIVAVGSDVPSAGRADGAVWTSLDAREWHREGMFTLDEEGEQRMKTVAALGDRVVALGRESFSGDDDVAAWSASTEER